MITIDDILHPGEQLRTLDAQIGYIDAMLHALSALAPIDTRESLEQPSLLGSAVISDEPNTATHDCSVAITHIDGGAPRVGLNIVPVFGERIQALVTREDHYEYIAQEVDFDLGRPTCCAHSPLQALRDLQSLLEDEHLRDCRRRDCEFARSLAKAELP